MGRGWIVAAAVAVAAVGGLALHGQRGDSSVARFEAAGVMLHVAPARVRAVEVQAGAGRWRFVRAPGGPWTVEAAPQPPPDDFGARLDAGLRFLHASEPQRVLAGREVAAVGRREFGLDPPHLRVTVTSEGPPFVLELGAVSPQGVSQYARVIGREEVVLLPRFAGEPWDAVTAAR